MKRCSSCKVEKEDSLFSKKKDKLHNQCKECRREYYLRNRDKILQDSKSVKFKQRRNKRHRERRKKDMHWRTLDNCRRRINSALEGKTKSASTEELIGCSIEYLNKHLENQFTEGMGWDNRHEWHIDHIRPCASFDLSDPAQQRECFHYSNLQPLWAEDNMRKNDKWT